MQELLSIKLFALRAARIFPNISINFKPDEGVLGRVAIPRRLFLIKRSNKLNLVFTKSRFENVHDLFYCEALDAKNLLFESYQAGEYTTHDFLEFFDFMLKKGCQEHYLGILAEKFNRLDKENLEDHSSPIELFGEDLTRFVNRSCCHHIGKRFENSIDLLESDDEECWGRDLLDLISDLCLLAPSDDSHLNERMLKGTVDEFGGELVNFVRDRSQDIFYNVEHRFTPNLFLNYLLSEEAPQPHYFNS